MNFMSQKTKVIPTAKPGNQYVTISSVEPIEDEKGARVLVTFDTENGAKGTRMFFAKSMQADSIKEMDKNYNNMMKQYDLEEASPSEVFIVGNKYYANLNYGVSADGFNNLYINIHPYKTPANTTEEAVEI